LVVPRKSGRLGGVAGSVVEYVTRSFLIVAFRNLSSTTTSAPEVLPDVLGEAGALVDRQGLLLLDDLLATGVARLLLVRGGGPLFLALLRSGSGAGLLILTADAGFSIALTLRLALLQGAKVCSMLVYFSIDLNVILYVKQSFGRNGSIQTSLGSPFSYIYLHPNPTGGKLAT
jgi:hypothetical protein